MGDERRDLTQKLEAYYRASGWPVKQGEDGILRATGPHGVTWISRAVVREDLESDEFEAEIVDLAERRMPEGGELCPLELLPAPDCAADLQMLLDRAGLARCTHVSVYSLAA